MASDPQDEQETPPEEPAPPEEAQDEDEPVDLVRRRLLFAGGKYVAPAILVSLVAGEQAFGQIFSCMPSFCGPNLCMPANPCLPTFCMPNGFCLPILPCFPSCMPSAGMSGGMFMFPMGGGMGMGGGFGMGGGGFGMGGGGFGMGGGGFGMGGGGFGMGMMP